MRPLILVPTRNYRHWNACYLQLLSVQRCQHPPQAERSCWGGVRTPPAAERCCLGGVPTPPEASPHARGGVGREQKCAPFPGSDVRLLPGGVVLAVNHVASVDMDEWLDVLDRCATKAGRPLADVSVLAPEADFPSPDGRHPLKMALARVA